METAGDHQMKDDEELALHLHHDAFPEPVDAENAFADQLGQRRVDRSQQKGSLEPNFLDRLPRDTSL
jgi:hypothetical protein